MCRLSGDIIVWCKKMFLGFFTGVALLVAVLVSVLPKDQLIYLVNITRFFEVMLPILAVGALLKYLCTPVCDCSPSND